jgi:hypothetical protein
LKYIVNRAIFKFAVDSSGLYGSDVIAAKAAGHDLKVIVIIIIIVVGGLFTDILLIVDCCC